MEEEEVRDSEHDGIQSVADSSEEGEHITKYSGRF